ncbi:hypothetical protein GCM10009759_40700 [Kitasatospora saccharophila]|uniref:SPOR domain-containing protein n=2 Tax=Kitasatospora saccharophila TaxID=407973 RepID=A0ABN2X6Y1_9ACTN
MLTGRVPPGSTHRPAWWSDGRSDPPPTGSDRYRVDMDREQRPAAHRVMRQDDNGNRFLLARGLDRAEAEALAAEFEARGHKQLYWVEPEDPAGPAEPA